MSLAFLATATLSLVQRPPPLRPHFGDPLGLHDRPRPAAALPAALPLAAAAALPLLGCAAAANADVLGFANLPSNLQPATFQPVCAASDTFYRFGQQLVVGLVGPENVKEYAPLIAGGLLRVRLELCVLESFLYEAIIPFVKERGLSWVLPLHETVETFLAGVIFAVASNFILLGSSKILTVIVTYADIIVGFPFRLVGNAGWRGLEGRAEPAAPAETAPKPKDGLSFLGVFSPKPKRVPPTFEAVVRANKDEPAQLAQLAVFGSVRGVGQLSQGVRKVAEGIDVFVGRYLLLTTVAYVGIKFVHYKLFDPFPI